MVSQSVWLQVQVIANIIYVVCKARIPKTSKPRLYLTPGPSPSQGPIPKAKLAPTWPPSPLGISYP